VEIVPNKVNIIKVDFFFIYQNFLNFPEKNINFNSGTVALMVLAQFSDICEPYGSATIHINF
jgi:hypothetical protein